MTAMRTGGRRLVRRSGAPGEEEGVWIVCGRHASARVAREPAREDAVRRLRRGGGGLASLGPIWAQGQRPSLASHLHLLPLLCCRSVAWGLRARPE